MGILLVFEDRSFIVHSYVWISQMINCCPYCCF